MAQKTITAKSGSAIILSDVDTWSNARNASTGRSGSPSENGFVASSANQSSFENGRAFLNFSLNTAPNSIPRGSRITGVTFVHPVVANLSNVDTATLHVVAHTAADPVVKDDYNNITLDSDTSLGSIAFSSISTSTTTNITLNQTGINLLQTALSAGTVVKYGLRTSLDINNTTPTSNTGVNQYSFHAEATQIVVSYIPPAGAILGGGI